MKLAFHADIRNDQHWVSSGAIKLELYIFAEEITEALMIALGIAERLRDKFSAAGHPAHESLRLYSIREHLAVTGCVGIGDDDGAQDQEAWIARVVARAKKEANL